MSGKILRKRMQEEADQRHESFEECPEDLQHRPLDEDERDAQRRKQAELEPERREIGKRDNGDEAD